MGYGKIESDLNCHKRSPYALAAQISAEPPYRLVWVLQISEFVGAAAGQQEHDRGGPPGEKKS